MPNNSLFQNILLKLTQQAEAVTFDEVILAITEHYSYQASTFYNGQGEDEICNSSGSNEGSCKIFAFAQLNKLTEAQTLACFGKYYREDVLSNPTGTDHQNIRRFIKGGWQGIRFEKMPLTPKK